MHDYTDEFEKIKAQARKCADKTMPVDELKTLKEMIKESVGDDEDLLLSYRVEVAKQHQLELLSFTFSVVSVLFSIIALLSTPLFNDGNAVQSTPLSIIFTAVFIVYVLVIIKAKNQYEIDKILGVVIQDIFDEWGERKASGKEKNSDKAPKTSACNKRKKQTLKAQRKEDKASKTSLSNRCFEVLQMFFCYVFFVWRNFNE